MIRRDFPQGLAWAGTRVSFLMDSYLSLNVTPGKEIHKGFSFFSNNEIIEMERER